ncbi:DUF6463 family protein [Parapedobacter tibetensis]|uniref:DUF6463 family protein n=1 Tax=Parapedobacter tibetensis TaxID=2972951 RepID=UPI00214DC4BA|nr:DUF6463 family protein [Parapedobacter tibetensis]
MMSKALDRYSSRVGIFIIVIGTGHLILGFIENWPVVIDILQSGVINTVNETPERYSFYWYEISGLFVLYIGFILQQYQNEFKKPVPKKFGYYLLIIVTIGCLLEPVSGFYFFIIPALLIIFVHNKNSPPDGRGLESTD